MRFFILVALIATGRALNVRVQHPLHLDLEGRYEFIPDANGSAHLVDVERLIREESIEEPTYIESSTTVRFDLYTPENTESPQIILPLNIESLAVSNFNPNIPTRFFIHGWYSLGLMTPRIVEGFFNESRHKVNLIVVNWQDGADTMNYVRARRRVQGVGRYVAQFIDFLVRRGGMQLKDLTVIGFSLGGHVSGIAGKNLQTGRIANIVGLDPASPLFRYANVNGRLADTDAEYVETIQTCGGYLGFSAPLGNASFFPNGGTSQVGCGWDLSGGCAHSRAFEYYVESLQQSNGFYSLQCSSTSGLRRGNCRTVNEKLILMGGEPLMRKPNGIYFLRTNSQPEFALGKPNVS